MIKFILKTCLNVFKHVLERLCSLYNHLRSFISPLKMKISSFLREQWTSGCHTRRVILHVSPNYLFKESNFNLIQH